jgi:hypothetical protein
VLADFAQLTPERAATVTADPYHPGRLRVAVSGPAPHPGVVGQPLAYDSGRERRTAISIGVQRRDAAIDSDLAWAEASEFAIVADPPGGNTDPDFILWSGVVSFTGAAGTLKADHYRLLIREREIMAADGKGRAGRQSRLIYAETIVLDGRCSRGASGRASARRVLRHRDRGCGSGAARRHRNRRRPFGGHDRDGKSEGTGGQFSDRGCRSPAVS